MKKEERKWKVMTINDMPSTFKTKEQWEMFIYSRKIEIKWLKEVIKKAKQFRKEL